MVWWAHFDLDFRCQKGPGICRIVNTQLAFLNLLDKLVSGLVLSLVFIYSPLVSIMHFSFVSCRFLYVDMFLYLFSQRVMSRTT